jgi:DNA-binding XRE family transcriptional regulator
VLADNEDSVYVFMTNLTFIILSRDTLLGLPVESTKDNTLTEYLKNYRIKIGESIREIREKRGYNQEQLAEIMKVSRSTISKIESGKFNFSMDYLSKFSWFLQFDFKVIDNKLKE